MPGQEQLRRLALTCSAGLYRPVARWAVDIGQPLPGSAVGLQNVKFRREVPMFSTSDLLTEIECGLYASWYAAFLCNDTPYTSMKPEYLTTVVLGLHLANKLQEKFRSNRYLVRFEERTKDVATCAFSCLPPPYVEMNVYGRAKKDTGEEGSVDLVIYRQQSLVPETVAVFEIKNFDQSDELLVKDILTSK